MNKHKMIMREIKVNTERISFGTILKWKKKNSQKANITM